MTEAVAEQVAAEPVAPVDPVAPPAEPAAEGPEPQDVASLPEWAQKLIGKTRTEAASHRTKAQEQAAALDATRDAIAKALGLKDDDDPVKAAQTAAQEREAAKAVARNLAVENAVLRSAGKHGADPAALTDSRSFMRALEALDPEADEFAAKVGEAITAAIEANPALKAQAPAPTPPARSGGPVGGGAPVAGQLGEDDIKGMSPAEIVKAKEDGRLNQLLGITQ